MMCDFYISPHKGNLSLALMSLAHLSLCLGWVGNLDVQSVRSRRDLKELFKEFFLGCRNG